MKKSVGMILKDLRGERTQAEVAADIGITKSAYAMYEQDNRIPRDEVKVLIANYYGVSVMDIFYTNIEHKSARTGEP